MKPLTLLLLLALSACTTSYKHLSDPRASNDGYDLICGGVETGDRLTLEVDVCHNVSPNGGEFVFAEVKYHWRKP